jgi:hypothetical protein
MTPMRNYFQRRRDLVMRNLPMAGVAGKAQGRFNLRIVADQMYRDWSQYLGTTGQKPNNHVLAQFIHDDFSPESLTKLEKQFPFLA